MKPNPTLPAGYSSLVEQFAIHPIPHYRTSRTVARGAARVEIVDGLEEHTYPKSYQTEQALGPQLEFALKYDGMNLAILKQVFRRCDVGELTAWIRSKPHGRYTRRGWFLFEWLMNRRLDIPDLASGTYIDLLDPERYYTSKPRNSSRHQVRDNLLGTPAFCPIISKKDDSAESATSVLKQRIEEIVARFDPALWQRASQYLYVKETRSSFEIEREKPNQRRTLRFVELLGQAGSIEDLDERTLTELQNSIVEERYAESGFRNEQNYVGQTIGYRDHVHFICPKPDDVPELMAGLAACHDRMAESETDPVVWAAALSFGFVFIHPFLDGNGRLHRFLIHHVLARTGLTPRGTALPVSATMLARPAEYDRCLESFSKPLNRRIEFELDHVAHMTVHGPTADYYRYFDATRMVAYLRVVLRQTIDEAFLDELEYLERFDAAWQALREIVDMPDQKLNLFIRLCLGNNGRLSDRKRRSQFHELTDDEIVALEQALADTMQEPDSSPSHEPG
jgi:Fic/DOC family